jgi:hypothetical protein
VRCTVAVASDGSRPSASSTARPSGRSPRIGIEQRARTAEANSGGQVGRLGQHRRRRHLELLACRMTLVGAALEGPPPGQRLVQHHPDRVPVAGRGQRHVGGLLGRHVRPACRPRPARGCDRRRPARRRTTSPKSSTTRRPLGVDQHVGRLEVAVQLAGDVQRVQRVGRAGRARRSRRAGDSDRRQDVARDHGGAHRRQGVVSRSGSRCRGVDPRIVAPALGRTQSMNGTPRTSSIVKNHSSPVVCSSCSVHSPGWARSHSARNSRLKRYRSRALVAFSVLSATSRCAT